MAMADQLYSRIEHYYPSFAGKVIWRQYASSLDDCSVCCHRSSGCVKSSHLRTMKAWRAFYKCLRTLSKCDISFDQCGQTYLQPVCCNIAGQ